MADIPAQVPVFIPLVDNQDFALAIHQNNPNDEISALATFVGMMGVGKNQSYGTDILAALCNDTPLVTKVSTSSIGVSPGSIWIKNSTQSIRMPRRITVALTLTSADLDTGSMAVGFYYIYAIGDSATNTFTAKFSASSSAPTGYTNYELIGWFYNETVGVLDITTGFIGNVKKGGRDVPNWVKRVSTTGDIITDTSYGTQLTGTEIKFYSSGRPLVILFSAGSTQANWMDNDFSIILDVDGSQDSDSEVWTTWTEMANASVGMQFTKLLAAGPHTLTIKGKVIASADHIDLKQFTVFEL